MMTEDIRVENHGSLFLLTPMNERATLWLDENLDPEVIHFGGAFVVEPRYARDIVTGAIAAGLVVR